MVGFDELPLRSRWWAHMLIIYDPILFFLYFWYLLRRWIITLNAVRCDTCWDWEVGPSSSSSKMEQPRGNMQTTSQIVCISDRHLLRFASCEMRSWEKYSAMVLVRNASIFSSACKLDGRVYVGIFGTSYGTRLGLTGLKNDDEKQ